MENNLKTNTFSVKLHKAQGRKASILVASDVFKILMLISVGKL